MREHVHTCPRCRARWHCESAACQAPLLAACPACFCAELKLLSGAELARATLRMDGLAWFLAGAAGLMFLAACLQ